MQKAAMHIQEKRVRCLQGPGRICKNYHRTVFHTTVKQEYLPNIYPLKSWRWILYNIVRIIAGTLVYVGLGKIAPDNIPFIIESKTEQKRDNRPAPWSVFV